MTRFRSTQNVFAVCFLASGLALTATAWAVGITASCSGYCSDLPAIPRSNNTLQYCCELATTGVPTWACVCRIPTDCTKANGCQDPG